jgi:phosphatidylglycerophosphate synthase
MATTTRRPSIAELRAVGQPAIIFARNSGEHWAGRLYVRKVSPYLTRALLRARVAPNAVTACMAVVGLAAAGLVSLRGIAAAVGAAALIQLQILLDCCDGELARWLDRRSPAGVYLDRLAHWLTEAALPIGLGVRADGGWGSLGGWTSLGLVTAVLVLLIKGETVLVHVARAESGLPPVRDAAEVAAPRASGLARARRLAGRLPLYRAFVAIEFTLLALVAAIVDAAAGDLTGTRVLAVALVPLAAVTAAGHLLAILASSRLR